MEARREDKERDGGRNDEIRGKEKKEENKGKSEEAGLEGKERKEEWQLSTHEPTILFVEDY